MVYTRLRYSQDRSKENGNEFQARIFYILGILHIGSVLVGMTVTARIILVNIPVIGKSFYITGGAFFIPVVFFLQDIVTEIYGYKNAKKMLFSTLSVFIFYVLVLYFISFIPCDKSDMACESYTILFSALPRHMISFVLSLAIGGSINNYILSELKLIFNSKFLAMRFISATAIGEAVFQFIAVTISWYGTYSIVDILPIAIISYIYKILFEVASTPINLFICRYIKILIK